MKNANRPQKGTPTALNVWVLHQLFGTENWRRPEPRRLPELLAEIPNQILATDHRHLPSGAGRAGLVKSDGCRALILTDLGRRVLEAYRAAGDRLTDEAIAIMSDAAAEFRSAR